MLCREPITMPLGLERVSGHIQEWLPPELAEGFQKLDTALKSHMEAFIRAGELMPEKQLVCVHCYVREVYGWMSRQDPGLAERFISAFSFGYARESFEAATEAPEREGDPAGREFGICDECGEYSEGLESVSGEWLCEGCVR